MKKKESSNVTPLVDNASPNRRRVQVSFEGDPGRTEKHLAPLCDINKIIGRHLRDGTFPHQPVDNFVDLTNIPDYQTALNTVLKIDDAFAQLPSNIRAEFSHDPAALMAALEDPTQHRRLIEIGVLEAKDGAPVGNLPVISKEGTIEDKKIAESQKDSANSSTAQQSSVK